MNRSSLASRLGTALVAVATALVLVAVAIVPFLSPAWVAFEQDRSGVLQLVNPASDPPRLGCCRTITAEEVRGATNSILADLVLGPPDFDAVLGSRPALTADERSHMRDVRAVFIGLGFVASAALVVVIAAFALGSRRKAGWSRADAWRAVRRGAVGLGIGVVVAGIVSAVAFDAAFDVFHQLFFPGGNWAFDPQTSRLVQLFPFAFWFETTIAVGVLILALVLITAWFAGRRLQPQAAASATTPSPGSFPASGSEPAK